MVVWPSLQGTAFAFTDWDGLSADRNFVGLEQFRRILDDPGAFGAIGHTLLIAPAVVTPVATAYLWKFMYTPEGALNQLLGAVGLGALQQNWLGDSDIALWAIVGVVVWQFAGYSMVIFLAALQGVPQEIIEASHMDGAGPFRRFWSIIRPELAPAITINLMLSIIGGLKLFDQVWVMTGGGPGTATDTMSTMIYKNAFQFGDFGYGIAMALILTLFVAVLSGAQYGLLSRQGGSK